MITLNYLYIREIKMINNGKKTNLKGMMREIGEGKNFHNLNILIS